MSIRRDLPKNQGELGVADAVAWFTRAGWTVAVPLVDNQRYDLVADDGATLHRVQVKTSTRRTRSGTWEVELRTNGGNRSRSSSVPFDPSTCDLLYVLTDGGRWLLPAGRIRATSSLTVGRKWEEFRVEG